MGTQAGRFHMALSQEVLPYSPVLLTRGNFIQSLSVLNVVILQNQKRLLSTQMLPEIVRLYARKYKNYNFASANQGVCLS